MIKRDYYLNKMISKMGNGLIKVITGVRRCGKSYLLFNIFKNYLLKNNIDLQHIICVQLDRRTFADLQNPDKLLQYITNKIIDDNKYYVFIDEIQMCSNFESVLNEFMYMDNVDAYVTGSNSKLLSKDIITQFRGRGDEIQLNPLSFFEFYQQYNDFDTAWNDYYVYGGMPFILKLKDSDEKIKYLKDLFKETYIKDIVERNNIKDDEILEDLLNILASTSGSLINPNKLINTFKSIKNIDVSSNTLKKYLKILEDVFLIKRVLRYDVKGKKYINTPYKYYFIDQGLRNARLNFRQIEENHIMENVIFNELNIRDFLIDVATVEINEKKNEKTYYRKQLECDFIASKGNLKYYIQSAYYIQDKEKEFQEKRSLLNINDSFKKIIIVRNNINRMVDDNGIITMSLKEFLLNIDSISF